MIHSRTNKDTDNVIFVQPSRFAKILSDIRILNGVYVEGFVERMVRDYNYFHFTSKDIQDKNNNDYHVVKNFEIKDTFGKCSDCDCGRKRFINGNTGVCFYREDTTNNYTTKIPVYEEGTNK